MRISQGQQQIIDSLVCERLSAHEENLRAIEGFYNTKNQALVSPLENEAFSEEWNQYHLPHSIGEVVFWQFIVDIVLHARSYVGCEHLYLFAADQSIDEKLVGYYCNRLAFDKQTQLAVRQPLYDSECPFLSQEISKLDVRRDFFFSEFNSQQ